MTNNNNSNSLESRVQALGLEILNEAKNSSTSPWSTDYYAEKVLNWAMRDEDFKINLLRFVDVLPALRSPTAVIAHAQEYFASSRPMLPSALRWGLDIRPDAIPARIAARIIKRQVEAIATKFIVGASPQTALKNLESIRRKQMAFTVDLLGEATVSEKESKVYIKRYEELLDILSRECPRWKSSQPILANHCADDTPLNISVKLSALYSQISTTSTEHCIEILSRRLGELIERAKQYRAFVYVDMEDSHLTEITLETFKRTLEQPSLRNYPRCGIVLQTYLRRTESDLKMLIDWSKRRETPIGIRLVKGAYWDAEIIKSTQKSWPSPVWRNKASSDLSFERLTELLLANSRWVMPAFASHNIRSLSYAVAKAEEVGVSKLSYEIQCLYGMADSIKAAFVRRGYLVREYAPIGELIPGMAYLVRRLLENTSNEGFLRRSSIEEDPELLLRHPGKPIEPADKKIAPALSFENFPCLDFTLAENRAKISNAIAQVLGEKQNPPINIKPVIAGQQCSGRDSSSSLAPEDQRHVLAQVEFADMELADRAVKSLAESLPKWSKESASRRAAILFKTAEVISARRDYLTALAILEAGKQWAEADADVCEAIDFCNYYAHQAIKLGKSSHGHSLPGEINHYIYRPRGVNTVISPWNFPLAIPCGMTAAALVTGNTVALKPAEQTSRLGFELFQCFLEAGLPPETLGFLPGDGEIVGAHLARHPAVTTIVFTGSKDVGLQLIRTAAEVRQGQINIKRCIAEMGGKNAIIVDQDAELDEAVTGVIYSAFGYQGQKCSACSRVIVVGDAFEEFTSRLCAALESIHVLPASDPRSFVGPVIDRIAQQRILRVIEESQNECEILAEGQVPETFLRQGCYVPPVIFGNIPPGHRLLSEEIFGPVLAVVKAKSFEEALTHAMDSQYALTAAVYSRSPKNIALASNSLEIGNLYINRGSTGALVKRQPFGGNRMSGIGSKAGGPDYLLQFVSAHSITENTMRRGFAPEIA